MYGHPQGIPGQPGRYSTSNQQQPMPPVGYPQQYPHPTYQQPPAHHHPQQYHGHEMVNQNPNRAQQYGQYGQPYVNKNAPLTQPPSLIQPPALNAEEVNANSQFMQQRGGPLGSSNNQHSQFDSYRNQEEDPGWSNEEHIASMFWEQRCITMLDRFQWFFQRFQILRNQYLSLSEEMQKMDSEDEWHQFQQHHDQFHQKVLEMEQELSAVVSENEQLLQQKMAQDTESVWEQRYQELLGNFKSLQEEMAHVQSRGGHGGVPPEQYHQLQDQYNQLQYQYGQVVKELQKQQGVPHPSQFEMQINEYMHEIQNYKMKFDSLHNENVELQHMIVDLENQNKELADRFMTTVDRTKLEELMHVIDQKDREIQSLQQDFKARSNNQAVISQYESKLQDKNRENEDLRRIIEERQKEINSERSRIHSLEDSIKKRIREQYQTEKSFNSQKISQLEKNVSELHSGNKKNIQTSFKAENLQKKLAYSNQQITNLNDTLKKKNQELVELRSLTYQVDKLKQGQVKYSKVLQEKDRLTDTLKKKNSQIDLLHQQIEKLTVKIQEVTNKRQEYSTRNLMVEIEDLNDQIKRHEGQIAKLKNIIDLKEEYSLRLEQDIKKINDKFIVTEQTLIAERENFRDKEVRLNSKNLQHEKRMKNLDYQFNLQIKDNLEKEVKALRKQNTDKQELIRNMEEKELVITSQLAVFEKQKGNVDRDVSLIRRKEKQLEALNEAQVRRFKELESAYLAKEDELQNLKISKGSLSSEVNLLKSSFEEQTKQLKGKSKAIEELQSQISEQLGRGEIYDKLKNENGRLKIALGATQEELQRFKMQGESRLGSSKIATSMVTKVQTEKNETMIIHQLHQQNQSLKGEIAKMLQKIATTREVTHKETQKSPSPSPFIEKKAKSPQKKPHVGTDLNKRLNEFNSKLQFAISEENGVNLEHSRTQKLATFWQSERKELIDRYQLQLRELKKQFNNLKLGNSQISDQFENPKKQAYIQLENEKCKEEASFYKQKTKEQQDRNQTLININEELREKIDSVLKIKQSTSTVVYFKDQNKHLESENEALKAKMKKITEENKEFKIELASKNTKISQQYEFKLLEFELLIQDLKRKITYLQAEKSSGKNEEISLPQSMNISTAKVQVKKPTNQRQSKELKIVQSPKYGGIQEEFKSVLGQFNTFKSGSGSSKGSKGQGHRYTHSINISSQSYGTSRIDQFSNRVQRV